MPNQVIIEILDKEKCLENSLEIGLDKEWTMKSRHFDKRMKMQGLYVFHFSDPLRIIYVGKTRGSTMDFQTRLYRHATEAASQSNPKVYLRLKKISKETGKQILVSLIATDQLRSFFNGTNLSDAAIIDIYEQLLIHFLRPEIQFNEH